MPSEWRWVEQKPAGDSNENWRSVDICKDKIIASVYGGRVYYYNGSLWSETQPKGNLDGNWSGVSIDNDGRRMACEYGSYVYYYNGSSWSNVTPVGWGGLNWSCVSIDTLIDKYISLGCKNHYGDLFTNGGATPNFSSWWNDSDASGIDDKDWFCCESYMASLICGIYGGRLYVSGGPSLVETQPAGAADKNWACVTIGYDDGVGRSYYAGVYGGRLYYYSSGTWSEIQPAGDTNKNWRCCGASFDSKIIAGVYGGRLYYYNGSTWSEIQPAGDTNQNWISCSIDSSMDHSGTMVAAVDGGRLYYYSEVEVGPALKIEGITPGKLENTSWSDLSDVH
jgi:hypothetical protein